MIATNNRSMVLAGGILGLLCIAASPTLAQGVARFDGNWTAVINCANAADGARGYRLVLPTTIKAGRVSGSFNPGQNVASARLTGTIRADGVASLGVFGRTGDPRYSQGGTSGGQPYSYRATGRFEENSGQANRTAVRECSLSFSRS